MLLLFFLSALIVVRAKECTPTPLSDPDKKCGPLVENDETFFNTEYFAAINRIENDETLTAEGFRKELNLIIRGNHKCYDYNDCTWLALVDLDETPGMATNVTGFYSRKSFEKTNRDCGSALGDTWNREHVFPMNNERKRMCAYTDLHHLVTSDKKVNGERGSKDFMDGGGNVTYGENNTIVCTKCKQTYDTFEPPKDQKGAVARMLFYIDVRYDGDNTDLPKGREATPNLKIDEIKNVAKDDKDTIGDLCTLLKWHNNSTVSQTEINRNNGIEKWQGNRNPFIDRPGFVKRIWGDEICSDGTETPSGPKDDMLDVPVIIVSAFINPDEDMERGKEWVQIKNVGPSEISLDGLTLNDQVRPAWPLSGTLASGATKCLDNFGDKIQLRNDGGNLTLKNTAGDKEDELDFVEWKKTAQGNVTVFNESQCDQCRQCPGTSDSEREEL